MEPIVLVLQLQPPAWHQRRSPIWMSHKMSHPLHRLTTPTSPHHHHRRKRKKKVGLLQTWPSLVCAVYRKGDCVVRFQGKSPPPQTPQVGKDAAFLEFRYSQGRVWYPQVLLLV